MEIVSKTEGSKVTMEITGWLDTQTAPQLEKELEGLRTESPEGEKRLPHRLVRIRITAKVPVWPEYQPRIGATYQAERYPIFKAPGYVIESGGKRINIRANECVEV